MPLCGRKKNSGKKTMARKQAYELGFGRRHALENLKAQTKGAERTRKDMRKQKPTQ